MADRQSPLSEADILQEVARRYALSLADLTPLMVDEGTHVYAVDHHAHPYILKWMPSWEQSAAEIAAEVDWVNYLADHDVPVARALPSAQGVLVEVIPIPHAYASVVAYARAPGHRPAGRDLDATLFQRWGAVMGKMHRLARQYRSTRPSVHIPSWNANAQRDRAQIPADQVAVLEKWDALMQQVQGLPRHGDVYGLIHGDLQANNLVVADGRLTVIDFAACEVSWFVREIAIALYFHLWEPHPGQETRSVAAFFLDHLVEGYTSEHVLGAFWLEQLPTFLKLQELQIYRAIAAYTGFVQDRDIETIPAKYRRLLTRYRYNIEHEIPYLESAHNPWSSAP
ncbi:MAG: phosphotransferase [Actinomycetota bacterium]|nr:phosphotransferase [Actinomycetota bacterium]